MSRIWIYLICSLFVSWNLIFGISSVSAVVDPLSVPNNRVGIHILDTSEVSEAAKLVNSSGGDWGYVTIPIRSDDRDNSKWRRFFLDAQKNHLIPILRLVTYVDTDKWVTPTAFDLVDFANFLNQMPWPTKNRYVVLFNEPNHAKEWGGTVAPEEYARILVDAEEIFKSRSSDFFLLSAGLDMSAPNNSTSLDALEYYRRMTQKVPGWYAAVNGLSVHAYPNPGFIASPYSTTRFGITSYQYEKKYLSKLGLSGKPIFITETGTNSPSGFYASAFNEVWTDKEIVAVTPFLLFAGAGAFYDFSLLDTNRKPTANYTDIFNLKKTPGSPLLSPLDTSVVQSNNYQIFSTPAPNSPPTFFERMSKLFSFKRPYLLMGGVEISVEISDTDAKRNQGLSGRKNLTEGTGMLFVFPAKAPLTFWMKDMNFPLDFIWMADGKVVELNADIPPPSKTNGTPMVIRPANFADKVLEVNAGFIQTHHIKVGDSVTLLWK